MNDPILTPAPMIYDFRIASSDAQPEQPIYACSRDYGFDFDEDELARELLAPLPSGLAEQATLRADDEDFVSSHLWFLS